MTMMMIMTVLSEDCAAYRRSKEMSRREVFVCEVAAGTKGEERERPAGWMEMGSCPCRGNLRRLGEGK